MMAPSGKRPRFLRPLANNFTVRIHFATLAMIALRVFMVTMNYADASSAITRLIAEFGYAKRIQQTAILAPSCYLPNAKRVATTRHLV